VLYKLIWRNLWRNKRRTLITVTAITFAVVLTTIMRSMQLGSYERMLDNGVRFYTGYIQVHKNGYWDDKIIDNSFRTDQQLLNSIEALENVNAAVPRIESFALASYGVQTKGALILGIDPEKENQLTEVEKRIVEGENLTLEDNSALIGKGLAEYLKAGIGDTLVLIGQGYHGANAVGKYHIKGLVEFGSPLLTNQLIYLSLPTAQYFYDMEGLLTTIAIVTDKPKHVKTIIAGLNGILDKEELEILDWRTMVPELIQGIELDNISGIIMLLLLYAVIGFAMLGTFMMMTSERMYEFGVVIALGMKKWKLQAIVFLEITLLSLLGVVVGFVISLPIIGYFHVNPIYLPGDFGDSFEKFNIEPVYAFSLDPVIFYSQTWLVFMMAIVLSSYPMIKIMRLKPVTAMREG